jgi:hypothetical protein
MTMLRCPVIELGAGETAVAAVIASLRQAVNREAGVQNRKAGAQDVMTTELVGLYGELAFARWANLYPDLRVHLRAGSADAMWRGCRVDVKGTRTVNGHLWVDERSVQKGNADVYVLAHVNYATVTLVGWCYAHDIPRAGVALPIRKTYRVPPDALRPMQDVPVNISSEE